MNKCKNYITLNTAFLCIYLSQYDITYVTCKGVYLVEIKLPCIIEANVEISNAFKITIGYKNLKIFRSELKKVNVY